MSDQAAPPPLDVLLARREWVRRFARTLARDDASADDLEQDAWVAALEHPPRHVEAPAGWLRRVLVRRAIDVGVEGRRRETRERAASRTEATPASVDVVAAAESHRRVVEAVLALDEPYKTTVLLRFFDGLPPRDVAARMGVPVETVRARVRRACQRLREQLDEEHGGRRAAWLGPLLADRAPDDVPPPAAGGRSAAAYVGATTAALVAILVIAWLRPSGDAHGRSVAAAAAVRGGKPAASRVAQRGRDVRPRAPVAAATESSADEDASKAAPPAAPAVVDPKSPHEFTVAVVDERGAPVAGVHVRIDPAEMKDELEAVSDERGRAKFEVVGAVRTAAAKPQASDGRAWRPKRRVVVVPAGATSVEYVVAPGAWIHGRARLEDGSPYEWAEVVAIERGRIVASTFAGKDGAFELAVPESGAWDVSLTGMSHEVFGTTNTPSGRVTQVMDRGRGATDGEAVGVGPGRDGLELTAREPSGVGALRLLARTADGRPLAGVPFRVDAGGSGNLERTDADGRLVVENVPNCRVGVFVAMGPRDPRPWEDSGFVPPVGTLRLRPGADECVIEFQPARPIRGRVVIPDDLKRRDPAHPPLVIVRLQVEGQSVSLGWMDAAGRFTVFAPSASKGPFEASADAHSDDGRQYRASAEAAPGAQDVVLALTTDEPPPAPAPSTPFIAAPK